MTRRTLPCAVLLSLAFAPAVMLRAASLDFGGAVYSADARTAQASGPVSDSTAAAAGWQEVYPGQMWQKNAASDAPENTLLIAYAGYSVTEPGAENWAKALAGAGKFKYVIAVKGPAQSLYPLGTGNLREMTQANRQLIKKLLTSDISKIVIAAHSSGNFVAQEMLAMLKGTDILPGKTVYYDLDGGNCVVCRELAKAAPDFKYTCVGGRQGGLSSPNFESVKACGPDHFLPMDFNAGCTGAWCLHACLVNTNAAAIGAFKPSILGYYEDPNISVASDFLK